jgi:flagellar hook-associated protein 1 FlgK
MSGNLFLTGLSGLNVARSSLVTTAHNTANVYTAGYSRQTAQISTNGAIATGSGFVGMGSLVTTTSRSFDAYLTAQLNSAQSISAGISANSEQIDRIDSLLADTTSGLSPLMQSFFTATQGVANAPADPAARQQLVSSAQALANKFRSTDQYLTDLNGSINEQIKGNVDQINTYATQIASLNQQISQLTAMSGGQPPNDLLDQRDELVSQLSKIADVKVLEQDSGKYNVFIATGQSLVVGDRAATMKAVPSAADPSRMAVALVGLAGNTVELSSNAITGGSLGGLMTFRDETLIPTQNAVGRLSIALADAFNDQHNLGVDLTGALGEDFFASGSPAVLSNAKNTGTAVLSAAVTDSKALTTSDYSVEVKDVAGTLTYFVTRQSDKTSVGTFSTFPATFDGVTMSLDSGAVAAGDKFTVQPTRTGARDMKVLLTDPSKVAAASPVITGNTAGNQGSGLLGTATVSAAYLATPLAGNVTLTYDATTPPPTLSGFPATAPVTVTLADGTSTVYAAGTPVPYTDGAAISFGGLSMTMTGTPAQGDTFTINKNIGGVSDGSNALKLAALQRAAVISGTTTFNGAYTQLVSTVGNRAQELSVAEKTQTAVTAQIKMSQQGVSGVNQDEETANLLMFQQMYQANAKVIQTASTIFDAILGIRG